MVPCNLRAHQHPCGQRRGGSVCLSTARSGLGPSLFGIGHVAIQFPLYEATKARLAAHRGCHVDDLRAPDLVLASGLAKVVASMATYPHEVVRSYMHIEGAGPFHGLASTCRRVRVALSQRFLGVLSKGGVSVCLSVTHGGAACGCSALCR
jgi:hypothetical protein